MTVTIRLLAPHEWCTYRDLRLAALADSPDAFGSTLAAELDRQPDQWRDRLAAAQVSGGDLPLVAIAEGRAVGLVWAKEDVVVSGLVNVFQMWVAPEARKQGIARAMLDQVISWARSIDAIALQLGVTSGDTAAARLYTSAGFRSFGPYVPLRDGSPVKAQNMKLVLNDDTVHPPAQP